MSARSVNLMSQAQREKIAEALNRAASARRRANGATRGLAKMLAGFADFRLDEEDGLQPANRRDRLPSQAN